MILKTLNTADIHFGKGNAKLRSEELSLFCDKILDYKPHIVTLNGDYFDKKLSVNELHGIESITTFNKIKSCCNKVGAKLIVLQGTLTHDVNQINGFRPDELDPTELYIITTITELSLSIEGRLVNILCMPEEYMEDQYAYYDSYKEKEYDLVLCHGQFDFAGHSSQLIESERPIKGSPTHIASEWYETGIIIICGHVHKHQNKRNIYYTGSISRLGFGEEEDKGYLLVELDLDKREIHKLEFIKNHLAPTFNTIVIEIDKDSVVEEIIKEIEEKSKLSNRFRVKYKTLDEEGTNKLKLINEAFSLNNTVKIEKANYKEENIKRKEISTEFDFLLEEITDEEKILQFIEKKYGKAVSKEKLIEILKEESK